MKLTSLLPPAAAVALMAAAVLATTTGVQATQDQPQASRARRLQTAPARRPAGRPMRNLPAPTNLQVLPKDLTGDQVHEIMEGVCRLARRALRLLPRGGRQELRCPTDARA